MARRKNKSGKVTVVVAKQPGKSTRKRSRKNRRMKRMAMGKNLSAFARCYLGSVGDQPMGMGLPDSFSGNSITLDNRMVLTVLPDSAGNIAFAIVPSCLGGIAIQKGIFTTTVYDYGVSAWVPVTFSSDATDWAAAKLQNKYTLLPYSEYWRGIPEQVNQGTSQVAAYNAQTFRCLKSGANVMYMGNSFYDSGSALVARQTIKTTNLSSGTAIGAPGHGDGSYQISSVGPTSQDAVASLVDAVAKPIRCGLGLNNVHESWAFTEYKEGFLPSIDAYSATPSSWAYCQLAYNSLLAAGSQYQVAPMPGFSDMTCTFVQITGMATGANAQPIMINNRNCVEMTVGQGSPVAKFVKPSPREDPRALKQVSDISRMLPAAITSEQESEGWLAWAARNAGSIASGGAQLASYAAELIPYVGPGVRGGKALYNAFSGLGGGNALAGMSRYAIGY